MRSPGASRARRPAPARLDSVDLLRGVVIVVMALDHARDFFGTSGWDPSFATSSAPTFLTRWVTHFCAPVFVLLAGAGAGISLQRGKPKRELAWFLLTRGAWLALVDVTVISFSWFFRIGNPWVTDVMWAIGWSMIVLAGLVYLPVWATTALGALLVAGHNVVDGIHADALGSASWLWKILHEQGIITFPSRATWFVGYPLVPWIGVTALGYSLGFLLTMEPARRRRQLIVLGITVVVTFVVLRAADVYGDPQRWAPGGTLLQTIFSFVACHKYPPSLLFLAMTLGPALLALAALDRVRASPSNPLLVFGRVPLFFYVIHLYLIHFAAGLWFYPRLGMAAFHVDPDAPPPGFGVPLAAVYVVWAAAVALMYPPCRWFAGVKQRRRSAWLSYF